MIMLSIRGLLSLHISGRTSHLYMFLVLLLLIRVLSCCMFMHSLNTHCAVLKFIVTLSYHTLRHKKDGISLKRKDASI